MDHDGSGMGWAGWLMMGFTFVALWGVVIAAIIWGIRNGRSDRTSNRATPAGRADELLAERFARGEIDEQEFARRRDILHDTART